ncbi:MAG: hypothetical protein IKP21_04890 [Bacteroidales bacterium]|nr:hypothetical protein [Bacteroidales bacterium]
MKTRFYILLAAVLCCLTACEKNPESSDKQRDITYTVTTVGTQRAASAVDKTTTVHLETEAEWQALLDRFCDYAENGSVVTFYGTQAPLPAKGGPSQAGSLRTTKDATTFSTTDREAMKRWMAQMEDEGMTVTVSFDPNTGTWNGTAYATAPQPDPISDTVAAPFFSVSASRQVTFATGNLQYNAVTGEYRMAASQYATLCITSDSNWTDLFEQDTIRHLGDEWRLLSLAEARYLIEVRFCSTVAGVENARYARAKVAGVHGLIIFPDLFVWPDSVALPVGVNNNGFSTAEGWDDNDYSVADWQQLEAAGAVFLPGTNPCYYGEMYLYYADGIAAYWTSTPDQILVSGPSQVGTNSSWENEKHAIRYIRDNQ